MRFVITLLALVGLSVADVGAESIDVQAFYPSGGQRGTSVEVRVIGKTSHWPVGTWTSSPGIQVEAVPEKEQTLKVSIADNARPGIHWLRLHHELGAARLRPFIVETVREVMESSDADGPSQIDVTEPHIVNGRLTKNDEVDQYKVQLTQGQRLVAVLHAHRPLGSPMDAVMQIVDAEHQVILQQEDDTPGRDPRIVFTAPRDGDYVIRLFAFPETPTSRIGFAGAENFVYRLALSTAGYIDHAYPLAISKGQLDRVIAVGWGLPTSELQRIRRQEHDLTEFTLFHSGTPGWAPVRQLEVDCVCEQSDFSTASPSECRTPFAASGRIQPKKDRDIYRFTAKNSEQLRITVMSRSLGFPLDPVVRVLDDQGKELAQNDDSGGGRDCVLDWKAPSAGDYQVEVRDLNENGGPRYVYQLRVDPVAASYELGLASETFTIEVEKELAIPVKIARLDGFPEDIHITAIGLPPSVNVSTATSKAKGDTAKEVKLVIQSPTPVRGGFQIIGTTRSSAKHVLATLAAAVSEFDTSDLWLTVTPNEKTEENQSN